MNKIVARLEICECVLNNLHIIDRYLHNMIMNHSVGAFLVFRWIFIFVMANSYNLTCSAYNQIIMSDVK